MRNYPVSNRMTTQTGRAVYALRKQTVEPVFGIIKACDGLPSLLIARIRQSGR